LEDPDVDAVYVSLPNSLHHTWTMHALAAGKHVLCEKPYTRRPAQVTEAFDAADAAGLVLMEGFMYRHHPWTRMVQQLVAEGAIGRLLSITAKFTFVLRDLSDVRAQPSLDGGALMDVGCYCVSGARLLAGDPVSVIAEQVTGETGIDIAFYGTVRFSGDVVAQFESSLTAPQRQSLEVIGDEAVLNIEAPFRTDWPGDLKLVRDGAAEVLDIPRANAYGLELTNMADAVAGRTPPLLGRDDALAQARTIEALYQSAASGAAVSLSAS
jgi:predicted dehydrogenase